jgi:hypothetical protein
MTIEEPRHIDVALYSDQLDRLLVAKHTDTLEQLRPPGAPDVEEIRSLLEWQQEYLEDMGEEIKKNDADFDAVIPLLEDVRERQEEISDELEQRVIY